MYDLTSRTPEEYSNGHVAGAINVPYLLKEENGELNLIILTFISHGSKP
jgi:rhodanese-related sulfurtransferase